MFINRIIVCIGILLCYIAPMQSMNTTPEMMPEDLPVRFYRLVLKANQARQPRCNNCHTKLTEDDLSLYFSLTTPLESSGTENCFLCEATKSPAKESTHLAVSFYFDEYFLHDECFNQLSSSIEKIPCSECVQQECGCIHCCKEIGSCCQCMRQCISSEDSCELTCCVIKLFYGLMRGYCCK